MSPEAIAAQVVATDQARAAWSAAYATWASVIVNFAVVIVAVAVPYVLTYLERKRQFRGNAAGTRTGLIALATISDATEWIERAAKSSSRTVQDFQATVRRQMAGARYTTELTLARGVESPPVMSFLSEVLMLVREVEQILTDLPRSNVPDGVGVEVLTTDRQSDLQRARRGLSEVAEHQHALIFEGETLQAIKER